MARSKTPKTPLPQFKYHPDPLATGSVLASRKRCSCCEEARGLIYAHTPYGADVEDDFVVCPWCIADGTAAQDFDAEFVDSEALGQCGTCEVEESIVDEVVARTPGFASWQSEQWWTHCNDAAAFLGPVGYKEAVALGPEFLDALRVYGAESATGPELEAQLIALSVDQSPTAYAFRCLHCGKLGGYFDFD